MKTFERLLPTEDADIREIVDGILHAQARLANEQHRSLERGTHAKGICVGAQFEVFDLDETIPDPTLRRRLARGLFARPGIYPAIARFANASSSVRPDNVPDVRALSFSVKVPSAPPGGAARHDFSMNSAAVFTINDAHAFAVLLRVLEAGSRWRKLRALATLSPGEWGALTMTAIRARQQQRGAPRPYQRIRYWSDVPFRHGPDEAVKYTAIPWAGNPARDPAVGPDMLRAELARHVAQDSRMSEFDFAIQLLDADGMRRFGRRRDDIYWVENAGVEWPEDQAPFHVVGRLRLERGSPLPDDECRAFFADVTDHSTIDSQPLGSINRARRFGEATSHSARLGLADTSVITPVALAGPGAPLAPARRRATWVGGITIGRLATSLVIALVGIALLGTIAGGVATWLAHTKGMLPPEHVDSVTYPDRGWGAGLAATDRQTFYYTPQGAGFKDMPYRWFVNIEMPIGSQRLADPNILSRYGFLIDPVTPRNPDRLPVGFTRHFDSAARQDMLDISCAACHTGQLEFTRNGRTRALRVDGGQADHAFTTGSTGQFLPTLVASVAATAMNPFKFIPFAHRVLGRWSFSGMGQLEWALASFDARLIGIGWNESHRGLSPTPEGFGRTDALARIGNTVFAENLGVPANYHVGDAPVSFPPLWNIWKFDWVQYNASVSQPMARNIGEAMGVGADYAFVGADGGPLPPAERFRSTALVDSLDVIENTLRKLAPPAWPEDLLGPIHGSLADSGKVLFDHDCVGCHGPHLASAAIKRRNSPLKTADDPEWIVATLCADDIGTDPNAAINFDTTHVDLRRTGLTAQDLSQARQDIDEQWIARDSVYLVADIARLRPFPSPDSVKRLADDERELKGLRAYATNDLEPARVPLGAALSVVGTMIRQHAYLDAHYSRAKQDTLDGYGSLDQPQILRAYKARPLGGIWATPPFLHNGSVPTVYDLLSPPPERPKTFQVGSHEYDPVKLGLAQVKGFWTFDTSLPGNHNTGHEFNVDYDSTRHRQARPGLIGPYLSPGERMAIIEYLKVRNDAVDGPKSPNDHPPSCGR